MANGFMLPTGKKRNSVADQKAFDEETSAMLFEGASLSQLAKLFRQDIKKVKDKLHGCSPVSVRAGHPIYSIHEAAPFLVQPAWPIDEWIKRMNHTDLPVMLRKEYWAGMRSKQIYEQAAGDLWPTDKVIEHISEILKIISLTLRLSADRVEREVGLTQAQRTLITQINDEALANAKQAVEKMLLERKEIANADRAEALDEEL